jgi:hypothetical protein
MQNARIEMRKRNPATVRMCVVRPQYAVWRGIRLHVDEIRPGTVLPVRDSGQ